MKLLKACLLILALIALRSPVEAQSLGSVTTTAGKGWTKDYAPDINDDFTKLYGTPFVTIGNQTTFSAERALTAGSMLGLTDGGANSTVTLAVTDAELTCIGGLTSAADKIPYFTGSGTCALADFSSAIRTLITTPSSANLRALLNDEIGSSVLVFLGTPADDAVPVGDSTSATTWRTLPTTSATQKLSYDQSTNLFSAATDDDVPEAADYSNLTGGQGIANSPTGTILLKYSDTLAGNPTLGANECVFSSALAGGGLICEGSVADGFEGAFKVPDVTGADSTQTILTDASAAGGDLTGTYPNPTVAANSVALTTDTTGNYIADITAGTGITKSGSAGEGWSPTVGLDFSDAGASPSLNADECRFTSNATAAGYIVCEGDTADGIETRIVVTDPTVADKTFTIPNANSVAVVGQDCTAGNYVRAIDASTGAITCAADAGAGSSIGGSTGATDNSILRADGTGGSTLQASALVIADTSGAISGAGSGFSIEFFGASGTDTTLTAPSAGDLNIEGNRIYRVGGTDVAVADGGTGASSLTDLITLGTMTTGSYVQQVADGTGIDGTVNTEAGTYTPTLDLTEISSMTWGAGAFTSETFSGAGAIDMTWNYATSNTAILTQTDAGAAGPVLDIFADSASPAASDAIAQQLFTGRDSAANKQTYAQQTVTITDATSASEDATIKWGVVTAGTVADEVVLDGASFSPNTSDGNALGTGSLMWSDLFLASGGVINFNNGNYTLTHSAGLLTGSGAFSVGTSNAITAGTIELGAASDTTLARSGAGAMTVEGVGVALNSTSLTHTASTIELGNASDTTLARSSAGNVSVEGSVLAKVSDVTAKTENFCFALSDETTALTTGTKVTFRMPYAFTVTAVRASVTTAATGANLLTINILEAGVTILSTKITLDASEDTSTTAATPPVISDSSLADDAKMTFAIDQIGNTVAGAGAKVCIIGHQ